MANTISASSEIVQIPAKKFFAACLLLALALAAAGFSFSIPAWTIAVEVLVTVVSLFVFGSIRYRLDKNALTYGMGVVIAATFWSIWWHGNSTLRAAFDANGFQALIPSATHYLFTLRGWDKLVHADTMLFILGLTFFVAVIAQTRLLESISFKLLNNRRGNVVATFALLAAVVSVASGILDGVSMIGLMIRTMIVILFLSKAAEKDVIYAVMISTIVTTVCGMWLAYGEPPNLIMKSNLYPHLDNTFFLRYCLPVAVASYIIVFLNIRRRLSGRTVDVSKLDILDRHTADVRFLQSSRHGEVLIPVEFANAHQEELGGHLHPVLGRLHKGEPLGEAMVNENVPVKVRKDLLAKFVSEDLSEDLDHYYVHNFGKDAGERNVSYGRVQTILTTASRQMKRSQLIGAMGFVPFIGFLIWHAIDHDVPLFLSAFCGFAVSWFAVAGIPKMRRLALKEAFHEYREYLFLIPLFFSITLLQKTGFLDQLSRGLSYAIDRFGPAHVAFAQFSGTAFLSAILDNNVVADFGGRALLALDVHLIHLFSMAQIAGYAVGGCWTHIGSAQSVVAYSFIKKDVNAHFTPFEWIKSVTPIILEIFAAAAALIYLQSFILRSV